MDGDKNKKRGRNRIQPTGAEILRLKIVDNISKIIRDLIKWGALVFCVYWGGETFMSVAPHLAGKETNAEITMRAEGSLSLGNKSNVQLSDTRLWNRATGIGGGILCVLGIIYGRSQRKLRQKTIARLEGRIRDSELEADPDRTSSLLTQEGTTRPEDI